MFTSHVSLEEKPRLWPTFRALSGFILGCPPVAVPICSFGVVRTQSDTRIKSWDWFFLTGKMVIWWNLMGHVVNPMPGMWIWWKSRGKEKRRRKKIREEKGRKVAKHHVFPMFEGRKVGSLKQRVRSHLTRWEMKNCTPLWREAHFEVKMYKTPQVGNAFGSWYVEKVHLAHFSPRLQPT